VRFAPVEAAITAAQGVYKGSIRRPQGEKRRRATVF